MASKPSREQTTGGIGVLGALGILFVALKLTGVIDWPWVWVTIPFWGVFGLIGIILIGCSAVVLVVDGIDKLLDIYRKGKDNGA